MEPAVKSRPVYPPVDRSETSQRHLFIAMGAPPAVMLDVIHRCDETERQVITVDDIEHAKPEILAALVSATMATTAYVAGDEAFLWRIADLLNQQGLLPEQIKLFAPLSHSRRVFCCHCYHITDSVTHSPAACAGCGRLLAVTDHFSKHKASYMGYQVNAEDASEIPPAKELR